MRDRSLVATWLVKRGSATAPAKARRRRGVLSRKRAEEALLVVEDDDDEDVVGIPQKVWEAVADAISLSLCVTAKTETVKERDVLYSYIL